MLISRKRCKIETYTFNGWLMGNHIRGLSNGTRVSDLELPWRSFPGCRPFQVQSVEHLHSILPDSTDSVLPRSLSDSWASCFLVLLSAEPTLYIQTGYKVLFLSSKHTIHTNYVNVNCQEMCSKVYGNKLWVVVLIGTNVLLNAAINHMQSIYSSNYIHSLQSHFINWKPE